ncbi:hypothetical protein IG631_02918 [Alternaria alternata]|nr:hypothetical protein IG631_02918 [Alternaria alternata]
MMQSDAIRRSEFNIAVLGPHSRANNHPMTWEQQAEEFLPLTLVWPRCSGQGFGHALKCWLGCRVDCGSARLWNVDLVAARSTAS